jgi:integrase/recombinase XerD
VGHIRARLVGRARAEALSGGDDRRRYKPSLRARFVSHDSTEENLRTIQVLLGHRKIEHTTIYLRLSRKHLTAVANPLDTI